MKKVLLILLSLFIFISDVNAYSTSATSSILMDIDSNRIIHAKNINDVRSVASISKVMTAIIAIESNKLDDDVTVTDIVKKAYGSAIYIKDGEILTLKDLVYGLMLRSGNDAALMIAEYVSGSEEEFVKLMNEKAKELDMKNTTFNNPSGLDQEKGNYSTALDMAKLMSYAMHNKIFKEITSTKRYKVKTNLNYYDWTNKNKLLRQYKYATGGKTGYTEIARRTLITTASKNKLNLVAVTLNDGNDFLDHKNLFEEAFQEYTSYKILSKGQINIINENYYTDNTLYIKNNFSYPLLKSEKNSVIVHYKLKKLTEFKDNDIVGTLEVTLADKKIYSDNIYIKSNKIEKKWFK